MAQQFMVPNNLNSILSPHRTLTPKERTRSCKLSSELYPCTRVHACVRARAHICTINGVHRFNEINKIKSAIIKL